MGNNDPRRRRLPFFKIGGAFFGHLIFDRRYAPHRNLIPSYADIQ
ncbi:MAG: hypothetical protein PVH37_24820 [Desulfobacterales bacterium]